MAVAASFESDDRDRTIEAIHESRVIMGHTLSTVGFQGDPQLLLIDELQFVLRPAAVTLEHGEERRANVIPEHHQILARLKTVPGARKHREAVTVQDGPESVPMEWQHFEFAPLDGVTSDTPLLQEMIGVAAADEFRIDEWVLTLYYNPRLEHGPQINHDDALGAAVRRHFAASVRHLQNFRTPAGQAPPAPPTLLAKSRFLRLVLKVLRDQILTHLEKVDSRRFANITATPFALQYFLIVDTNRTDNGTPKDAHLCYFPLDDEVRVLDEQKDALNSTIEAALGRGAILDRHPIDFIRRYPWEVSRSLIGYTFASRAARYFPDWTGEPLVQPDSDSGRASLERSTATVIMQTLRRGTKHQFNIPLFANNQLVGAIIINTQDVIPWEARVLPVWCARQVGWVIAAALTMEPQVNDMARKIAAAEARVNQVRTYQHMLQSLVHHEGSYCEMLEALTGDLAASGVPETLRAWRPLVEYTSEDRRQLVREFENAPVDEQIGGASRILAVSIGDIYHQFTEAPLGEARRDLDTMKKLFHDTESRLHVEAEFGDNLMQRGSIPGIRPEVLRRVIGNIYRNSLTAARARPTGTLRLCTEIDSSQKPTELRITATDDCGGIDDREFPFGDISVRAWIDYLNELERRPREKRRAVHGMGFLTIARYAEATQGTFHVRNWHTGDVGGAEIIVRLGLQASTA